MLVKDIFKKDIDRKISAVVTLDTEEKQILKQEIEEYVVTKEIGDRLETFFKAYTDVIDMPTDETGVWISGFFGSGKSHFLKILGYLLDNEEIDGKRVIDYFIEDGKIKSQSLLANIRKTEQLDTDVILFDVDTKSDKNAHGNESVLVKTFYRVFMDKQGYFGSNPLLAQLERHLDRKGKLDIFKQAFEEEAMQPWETSQHEFDFLEDEVITALVKTGEFSTESARSWVQNVSQRQFEITPEDFAEEVTKYLDSKGPNHRIAFLADEIGQYIGEDSSLMLNLQSITKTLGTHSKGRAWMIVTSQQEFDENIANKGISAVSGRDFSKIQARFSTRLSLASTNVDEVIQKRLLEKQENVRPELEEVYNKNGVTISNLLDFRGGSEKKLFSDANNFTNLYPAIPYQVTLLGRTLNGIREHSASGRSMSEGERSMLGFFQKAAQSIEDKKIGALISFDKFYDSVQANLDDSHQRMIVQAAENTYVKENEELNLRVLKVLLLIKYVNNEIHSNIENITSLLVSSIDEDRHSLQEQVKQALFVLERENYIRKEVDQYFFLTNEEQEVNIEINNKNVDGSTIMSEFKKIVFEDILSNVQKVQISGRATPFPFGLLINDDTTASQKNTDLGLRIVTPRATIMQGSGDEAIRLQQMNTPEVLVRITDDSFEEEIIATSKIEQWIRQNNSAAISGFGRIKEEKQKELVKHKEAVRRLILEALNHADIFVQDSLVDQKNSDINTRIQDAEKTLITRVYTKLDYVNVSKTPQDVRQILEGDNFDIQENQLAIGALFDDIQRHAGNTLIGLRETIDRFKKPPYGFQDMDITWLIAKLYMNRDIELWINSVEKTDNNSSVDERFKMLTTGREVEKITVKIHEKTDKKLIEATRKFAKMMHWTIETTDEVEMMQEFQNKTRIFVAGTLDFYLDKKSPIERSYPGKSLLEKLRKDFVALRDQKETVRFYSLIKERSEDIMDDLEDFEDIDAFFKDGDNKNSAKSKWDAAASVVKIHQNSSVYINDSEIDAIVEQIDRILKNPKLQQIKNLPALRDSFNEKYEDLATSKSEEAMDEVANAETRMISYLETTPMLSSLKNKYETEINRIKDAIKDSNDLSTYDAALSRIRQVENNMYPDAESFQKRELERVAREEAERLKDSSNEDEPESIEVIIPEKPVLPKIKTIDLRNRHLSINSEDELNQAMEELRSELKEQLDNTDRLEISF